MMGYLSRRILWLGVVGLCFLSSTVQAQAVDVVTTGLKAHPKVIREGKVLSIAPGEPIREGDIVVTDAESSADIAWETIWDCRIAPDSVMTVKKVSLDSMAVTILLGEVLFRVKEPLPASGRLDVHAPGAIVGVRGTEFSARVRVEQLNAVSTFSVNEGEIEVRRESDSRTVRVRANESVDIEWRSPDPYEKVQVVQKLIG